MVELVLWLYQRYPRVVIVVLRFHYRSLKGDIEEF